MNLKIKLKSPIIFIILFFLIFLAVGVYFWKNPQIFPFLFPFQPKACTLDAKVCPDGTSVGRLPPDCEFAPCPSPASDLTKISPSLQVKMKEVSPDELLKIKIWLKEDLIRIRSPHFLPEARFPGSGQGDLQKEEEFRKRELIDSVGEKLNQLGVIKKEEDLFNLFIFASVKPAVIEVISGWEEVLKIEEDEREI